MKKHQFEEITAALSIIIAVLAYQFNINWLCYLYTIKAIFDTYCAIKFAHKQAMKEIKEETT